MGPSHISESLSKGHLCLGELKAPLVASGDLVRGLPADPIIHGFWHLRHFRSGPPADAEIGL